MNFKYPWGLFCAAILATLRPVYTNPQKPVQANQQQMAIANLNAGMKEFQAGQLDKAIARARQAFALAPQNPDVRLYLGLFLYEKSRDSLEAQRLMESVLSLFPKNSDLQLRLLDSYLRMRDSKKTNDLLAQLQEKMSADPRFAFDVVYTLIHHGQLAGAKTEIQRISRKLQGEVSFLGALIELGSDHGSEEALRLLHHASELGFPPPGSKQMLTAAESYFRLRDLPAAARAYEAYLKIHADADQALRFELGLCYYGSGDFDRALEQMTHVKERSPQTHQVDLYVGSILLELKKTEEARPYFQAELARDPGSFKAMTKLAYLEYLGGRDDSCRQWLEKSASLNARWFETHMVYGLLYNRIGDYRAAIQSLEVCVREEPGYPKAHAQLSLAWRRLGDEVKANQYLESFNRLQNEATARAMEALGLKDNPVPKK
jgi:tetratricopeptide (TPR) repeat protein